MFTGVFFILWSAFFFDRLCGFLPGASCNGEKDAAARTNHAIPPACGVYYYEVEILGKGQKGYVCSLSMGYLSNLSLTRDLIRKLGILVLG